MARNKIWERGKGEAELEIKAQQNFHLNFFLLFLCIGLCLLFKALAAQGICNCTFFF